MWCLICKHLGIFLLISGVTPLWSDNRPFRTSFFKFVTVSFTAQHVACLVNVPGALEKSVSSAAVGWTRVQISVVAPGGWCCGVGHVLTDLHSESGRGGLAPRLACVVWCSVIRLVRIKDPYIFSDSWPFLIGSRGLWVLDNLPRFVVCSVRSCFNLNVKLIHRSSSWFNIYFGHFKCVLLFCRGPESRQRSVPWAPGERDGGCRPQAPLSRPLRAASAAPAGPAAGPVSAGPDGSRPHRGWSVWPSNLATRHLLVYGLRRSRARLQ